MKIRRDLIRVATTAVDKHGNIVEPEQQPAQRRLESSADVGYHGIAGSQLGQMPLTVVTEKDAGTFAQEARGRCMGCKLFDQEAWKLWKAKLQSSADGMKALNEVRFRLFESGNGTLGEMHYNPQQQEMDLEHALSFLGICQGLTEVHNDVIIVHGVGFCPDEVKGEGRPLGLFVPASKEDERRGSQLYDQILNAAMGRR